MTHTSEYTSLYNSYLKTGDVVLVTHRTSRHFAGNPYSWEYYMHPAIGHVFIVNKLEYSGISLKMHPKYSIILKDTVDTEEYEAIDYASNYLYPLWSLQKIVPPHPMYPKNPDVLKAVSNEIRRNLSTTLDKNMIEQIDSINVSIQMRQSIEYIDLNFVVDKDGTLAPPKPADVSCTYPEDGPLNKPSQGYEVTPSLFT